MNHRGLAPLFIILILAGMVLAVELFERNREHNLKQSPQDYKLTER